MKKNILLALCCCSLLAFAGCSDDYTDATSKHIYGENENPYLKTNTNAQVTTNVALEVNGRHAYVLNLSDYTNKFEELMGMSVDAAVAGLDTMMTMCALLLKSGSQILPCRWFLLPSRLIMRQ